MNILLLAVGDTSYYDLAENLALSIKKHNPEADIALACDSVKKGDRNAFTRIFTIPKELYTLNGRFDPFFTKTNLHKITPYKETIFLDADTLIVAPIKADKNIFTQINPKNAGGYWGDKKTIMEYYNLEKLYKCYSGFIRFDESHNEIFETASEIYKDPNAPCFSFRGSKPDEFCFNVAMAIHDREYSHKQVIFMAGLHGNKTAYEIKTKYSGFTTNGTENAWKFYNVMYRDECIYNNYPHPIILKKDDKGRVIGNAKGL